MRTQFKIAAVLCSAFAAFAGSIDLRRAVVVVRPGDVPAPERTAATVLVEELERRSGVRLPLVSHLPAGAVAIAITSTSLEPAWGGTIPRQTARPEGFHLFAQETGMAPVVWVAGADPRGALYGVGHLLRQIEWGKDRLSLTTPLDVTTSPVSAIRGHQLGYRSTANSWDAWTVPQFELYIRELALFGINSVENIPFQDDRKNPLMKVPRREMNRQLAGICARYGLDYWVWTPASFDLNDRQQRERLLAAFDELFRDVPVLHGVFFPGGDPGDNPPEPVLAFLEEIARHMRPLHPGAKVWLSMQGFSPRKAEVVYQYLDRQVPEWFGGIVAGPSSPPIPEIRRRLPKGVRLRLYPDITHNKICQYEVPEWDQAYALTLGREAVNPRPAEYAAIHNRYAAMSDGFISYSDGVHDDVNKIIWSALAWDPSRAVRDILLEYSRLHFGPAMAEEASDGILALERNWRGPLLHNGGVETTLLFWRNLEQKAPQLASNWRWQMCLLRANYDAYVRRRLLQDTQLEAQANSILLLADRLGPDAAMSSATRILREAVEQPAGADLRARIVELCDLLFHSIGLQTSVAKYHASGAERGAVLDFIDNPLNNRWWLEDEFAKVRTLSTTQDKVRRLREVAAWEDPGPGSFYDNVGRLSKSPHVVRKEGEDDGPLFWWWDDGKSRARLSWQVTMWPKAVIYEGLDPTAAYIVRTSGYGQALLRIDGERVQPQFDGREMHEFKVFPVPAANLADSKLVLTWDRATDEEHLNWRRHSRLAEVWLLKRD
jgi:hypothetical protein